MTKSGSSAWGWGAAAVSAAGVLLAAWLGGGSRWPAVAGVLLAGGTFAFAAWMKAWAVRRRLDAALLTLSVTFALRLLCAGGGLLVAHLAGASEVAFVAGFFGAFLPLMLLEMGYVTAVHRAGRGQESAT